MRHSVSILGSTGSVGRQALEVLRDLDLELVALSARQNLDLLYQQCLEFKPRIVHLAEAAKALEFKALLEEGASDASWLREIQLLSGDSNLAELMKPPVTCVLIAISGFAALPALAAAIEEKQRIGLANKEAIVCAGHLFMPEIRRRGIDLIPVDSEHSAIWQCLQSSNKNDLERIYLTASGGPFRNYSQAQLAKVTVAEALAHPRWSMGKKISLDSASMMNKALELIEAQRLFDLALEKIEVLVHPEALIHSMVGFVDGSVLAQAAVPDMRLPIQLAFTWPNRQPGLVRLPDFTSESFSSIHFERVNEDLFPALKLARKAFHLGDLGPTIFNAANEVAAGKFLDEESCFTDIFAAVEAVLAEAESYLSTLHPGDGVEAGIRAIMEADSWARARAVDFFNSIESE
ncbi:MAG: 1-deoxy-D-xylulose-5-phosphate reductoisomerase [Eubacteriales bacterium]|nr:1-deoxy-D-xylulose-5-phosphate reductoisomerase [Eubacteriales bacterium]